MIKISFEEFEEIVSNAIDNIPPLYKEHLKNMAFLIENTPTPEQRKQLDLRCSDLLFGLYEGVPLPRRGGTTKLLPDKITIFKKPIETISNDLSDVIKNVQHTVWHEVAHYYGLDHKRIHELEQKL